MFACLFASLQPADQIGCNAIDDIRHCHAIAKAYVGGYHYCKLHAYAKERIQTIMG